MENLQENKVKISRVVQDELSMCSPITFLHFEHIVQSHLDTCFLCPFSITSLVICDPLKHMCSIK